MECRSRHQASLWGQWWLSPGCDMGDWQGRVWAAGDWPHCIEAGTGTGGPMGTEIGSWAMVMGESGGWTGTGRAGGACRVLTLIIFMCNSSGSMDAHGNQGKKKAPKYSILLHIPGYCLPHLTEHQVQDFLFVCFCIGSTPSHSGNASLLLPSLLPPSVYFLFAFKLSQTIAVQILLAFCVTFCKECIALAL